MTPKKSYSEAFCKAINKVLQSVDKPIIVLYGDTQIIDLGSLSSFIIDAETFTSTGGDDIFNKSWFSSIFASLSSASGVSIVSYAQFSYVTKFISADYFNDRVIILEDNLRRLFPLNVVDFIDDTHETDDYAIEIPYYQAEQLHIDNEFYYVAKSPSKGFGKVVPIFSAELNLEIAATTSEDGLYINPFSDDNDLDLLLAHILSGKEDHKCFFVKYYEKQPSEKSIQSILFRFNAFISSLGKQILLIVEDALQEEYTPNPQILNLLKKYWGNDAKFRDIQLYKNPNTSSEIVNVSQGKIVETLILEYENVRRGDDYRDVFLTAPTGAGKSLLFQLPAFYISDKGDVTIVVSPLIALMKDQVNAIINDRRFDKVAYLNSEISLLDRDAIIEKCKGGGIDILYMAPELLMSYDVRYFIGERKIGLIVVDEAHLITTWGRDFRVDYWYLGNQIRKIRKYSEQRFPMIAVTATAVYGGDKNDMVFDTVDSLVMHSPHYFIGIVKRSDIEFIINNYESTSKGFDTQKLKQTSDFIKSVNKLGFKTLVYAPYTEHVRKLATLSNDDGEIAVYYYGSSLDSLSKEQSEKQFRNNERNVMICTKAFGMGVDIPDIQVVYHHAPSGLLPDYVQEIGRAARKEGIQGYATLNYSQRDQKYSKQLYGMSSLKLWQIRAVLKKLYDSFRNNGKKRNMLLSVDDFAYAFEDATDYEQKVKTALMMIEKDYLMKYRYNIVIARPKQLFARVYATISESSLSTLLNRYGNCITKLGERSKGEQLIILDLNKIWSEHFSDISFPVIKRRFYLGKLIEDCDIRPKLKVSLIVPDKMSSLDSLKTTFETLSNFFVSTDGKYFEKDQLVDYLKSFYDDRTSKQLANFITSTYSGEVTAFGGQIEENAFLQEKHSVPRQYRVFGTRYEASFSSLLNLLSKMSDSENDVIVRYVSKENAVPYLRIGHLIEILNLGSYELRGGDSPMIFVRLNNPERVRKDAYDKNYSNVLFDRTQEKHKVSTEIMDYFFTHSLSNNERWNFIEDFFLGDTNEELIRKYPGHPVKPIDIVSELSKKKVVKAEIEVQQSSLDSVTTYPPRSGTYMPKDHLTIEIDGKPVTMTVREWIQNDPISFHKLVKDKEIYVDTGTVYKSLMLAIEKNHPEYYTRLLGLRKLITISEKDGPVMADAAMRENPVKFYKWWTKNKETVFIPLRDKIWLFDAVKKVDPTILREKDLKSIKSVPR